jgi:hypothetical protein
MILFIYLTHVIYYTIGLKVLFKGSLFDSFLLGLIWPIWVFSELKKNIIKWLKK